MPPLGRSVSLERIVLRRVRYNFVGIGGIDWLSEVWESLRECLHLRESEGAIDGSAFFENGLTHY